MCKGRATPTPDETGKVIQCFAWAPPPGDQSQFDPARLDKSFIEAWLDDLAARFPRARALVLCCNGAAFAGRVHK